MIISRELVNKNIKYHDCVLYVGDNKHLKSYDYNYLSSLVDAYKNLFVSKGAKAGRSVVIGTGSRIEQVALVLACAELGMTVTIVSNPLPLLGHGTQIVKQHYGVAISKQYERMLPIDFFVVCDQDCTDKFQIFKDTCRLTIEINKETLDYTPNNTILATDDTVFLKCPSSGTTGTPKIIEHTHGFFSQLVLRNSKMFYGKMGMLTNLNHGSSPGTYFIPGLVSENVTDMYNIRSLDNSLEDTAKYTKELYNISLNHIMVPYTNLIDSFLESEYSLPECVLYTLGIIRKSWINKLGTKMKDVISIFGSNETSGATLINQATDEDFTESSYKKLDDFYELIITDKGELEVKMPVYNTIVPTKDIFTIIKSGKYVHGGRSNLYRINDLEIDVSDYQKELDSKIKSELIIDTNKDRIYIAIWDQTVDPATIEALDKRMKLQSNNRHFISKYECLEYKSFLSGIKLDKEAVREYFRSMF